MVLRRALAHAFLALLLVLQGLSLSASAPPAGHQHQVMQGSETAMPCHQQASDAGHSGCCNADCPDMLGCALAALTIPCASPATPAAAGGTTTTVFVSTLHASTPPGAAFRPPILLPA